jgi:hypothetical protein
MPKEKLSMTFESVLPPKPGPGRGGRRPGAGAPKGNLNAFRNGKYSERFLKGALMIALLPEVQVVLAALKREDARKHRDYFNHIMLAALQAAETDPDLAESIRQLIQARIRQAAQTLQKRKSKSDNQTIAFPSAADLLPRPLEEGRGEGNRGGDGSDN